MKKYKKECKSKLYHGNRLGFTLVEAITTLVVLAIVAAVSIPSLVGYIDSSREKIAVQECSTVVEAANALGVEHVLETGVVNYDEVVPLADSSEPGKSVYSSVTKEAILKRAELEDKGEIKNFSFDPNDSHGYTQPAYLVNEEEVVVSAAAEITLAKDIVSPLAVSVEKTTDTEFKEAAGISLTSLEYTASNGIDVVYHNGGYQASSKVDIDFEHHDLEATVKQVLTCEQDEIVEFVCTGIDCSACDDSNRYRVEAITAFAPGHNYGSAECIDEDTHTHSCTNVLNQLAEGDKALSEGDDLDLEPQYDDFNNLPRVGVECTDKIDGNHFGDITEEVELTEDLERDIPFSLDGVYKSTGDVPAGKYTVTTCSGCGYSEYETQEPEQPKEPEDQDTTWEVDADGYGNWNKVPSSEVNTGGTIVNVSSNDGWGSNGEGNYYNGKQISVPYGPQIRIKNDSGKYIKKLAVTFIYTYSGVWNADFNNPCISGEIDVPISDFSNNYANMFEYSQEKIGKNTYAVHIKTTDYYTQVAKDYAHKNNSISPGREFVFQFHFAQKLWIDANYKIEVNELEYVETYATKFELDYQGDLFYFDYITLSGMEFCNEAGEPISTNEDFPKNNPINYYARVGDAGNPKVSFYSSDVQNPLFVYEIPREDVVAADDKDGIVQKIIPVDNIETTALKLIYNGVDKENKYQIRCYNNSTQSQIYSKDITSQKDYICKVYENLLVHTSDIRIDLVSRSSWKTITSTIISYETLDAYRGKILEVTFPTKDFAVKANFDSSSLRNYASKLRATGAGVSETVDVTEDYLISGLLPYDNNTEDIRIDVLSSNEMVIGTGTLPYNVWKQYSNGEVCQVNVSSTAFVLKLKTFITDSSISAKSAEINIKGADVYTDNKTVNINGGSANILVVPKADKITVNLKANGKTVATKDIEIPQLGTTGSITITNDDIYTGPDIPEPDKDKVNVYFKFNRKLKDDVDEIVLYYGDYPLWDKKVTEETVYVTDDGFVITNVLIDAWNDYNNIYVKLKDSSGVEIANQDTNMQKSDFTSKLGGTVEIEVKSNVVKLNVIYSGNDYSNIHQIQFKGSQSPNWGNPLTVNVNSNNIGSFIVTPNNGNSITVIVGDDIGWDGGIKGKYEIPWSDIQAHLGDELNVTIEPK